MEWLHSEWVAGVEQRCGFSGVLGRCDGEQMHGNSGLADGCGRSRYSVFQKLLVRAQHFPVYATRDIYDIQRRYGNNPSIREQMINNIAENDIHESLKVNMAKALTKGYVTYDLIQKRWSDNLKDVLERMNNGEL